MPLYNVKLPYVPVYSPHIAPGAGMVSVQFNPTTLNAPGDVETTGGVVNLGDPFGFTQIGKLNFPVKAIFPHDGFEIVFPKNSRVQLITNPDQSPRVILLLTDNQGRPVPDPVPAPAPAPAGGAGGQGGGRRRGSTRRRVSRHHSTGRRRSGTRRHRRS